MVEDFERCYRAVRDRDDRCDGRFVTAVRTTGIYCRPSCPARTPLARNVSFFASGDEARAAGYRACRRCHP
jgi:AraC family transcriptional regulator of adaptative response / DNA-3-methyladenine glycosylase II